MKILIIFLLVFFLSNTNTYASDNAPHGLSALLKLVSESESGTLNDLIQNLKNFHKELEASPAGAENIKDRIVETLTSSYNRLLEAGEYRKLIRFCESSSKILKMGEIYDVCARPHCLLGESELCRDLFEKHLESLKGDPDRLLKSLSEITTFLTKSFRLLDAYYFHTKLETIDPDKIGAKLRGAELLLKMNKKEDADRIFREIIENMLAGPEKQKMLGDIGKKLMHYHVYDRALFYYQEILKENPADITTLFVMIKIFYALKNNSAIISLIENNLAMTSYEEERVLKLANFLEFEPSREIALTMLKTASAKKPGSREIRFALGKALYEAGKTRESEKILTSLFSTEPDYAEKITDFYLQKNDRKSALKLFKQFKLTEKNFRTKLMEISLMVELGMFAQAEAEVEKGAKFLKEPREFLLEAGKIFYTNKKPKTAKKYLLMGIAGNVGSGKLVSESYFMLADIELMSQKPDYKKAELYLENYLEFSSYGADELDRALEIARNNRFENLAVKILTKKIEVSPNDPENYLELAELHIIRNKPDAALRYLIKYTSLSENKVSAINRAVSALTIGGMGNLEQDFYAQLEETNIEDPLFDAYLGQIYMNSGNILRAVQHFRKFISTPVKKSPQEMDIVNNLASRGLYRVATELLSEIIPNLSEGEREGANLNLGKLLILSGEYVKSEETLKKTVAASTNPSMTKFKAAKIFYETGRFREAEKIYLELLSGNINEATEAAKLLADIYVKSGNAKKVLTVASKLTKRKENREEAFEIAADILSFAGFHDESVEYLEDILRLNPSKRALHEKIAKVYLKAKNYEEAVEKFMEILNSYGSVGRNYEQTGRLFEGLARDKEALLFYDKGIEKGEKTPQIFLARGNLRRKFGEMAAAHTDSLIAIDLAGKPEEVFTTLRDSYFTVNDLERYNEILKHLSAKFQLYERVIVEKGIILMKLGKKAEGLNLIRGVFKTIRDDPFYIYRLLLEIGEEIEAQKFLKEMADMPPVRFSTNNIYEIVYSLIEHGETSAALKFLANLANGDHSTAGDMRLAANIFYTLGKYAEALKYGKASCALSKDETCPLLIGKLEYLTGSKENALREFMKLVDSAKFGTKNAPEESDRFEEYLGTVYSFLVSQRDFKTALDFMVSAGKIRESRAAIFYRLKLFMVLGRYDEMFDYFDKILGRQNLEFFADAISVMRHLMLNGKTAEIGKLIERMSGALKPLFSLWYSCTVEGAPNWTRKDIDSKMSELATLLPDIDFRIGEVLFDCGEYDLAREYFLNSLHGCEKSLLPRNLEMLFKADMAAKKGASVNEARKILSGRFDDILFTGELIGDAAYSAGFYGNAAEIFEELAGHFKDIPALHMKIFWSYAAADNKVRLAEAGDNYIAASENSVKASETIFSIYRELRKYKEARETISLISGMYSSNYQHLYNYLKMLILTGEWQAAKETAKRFIEASANRIEALIDIYSLYTELGFMSDGEELLDEIEKGDSLKYRRPYIEAVREFRSGDIEKSKELFSKAFESGCPEKEKQRALMPFVIAHSESEWLSKEAATLSGKNPQSILILAGVEILSGRVESARRFISEYTSIGYNVAYGMNLLGIVATGAGHYDLAIEIYETSLKFDPSDGNIAVIVAQIGDFIDPDLDIKKPGDPFALVSFGISLCERVLLLDPFAPSALTYKAEFLHFLGNDKLADETFEKVFRVAPHSPTLYNNFAYILAKQGRRLNDALKYALTAIQLQPTQGIYYYDTLGWVYFSMGKYTEALEWIKKSEALLTERQVDTAIEVYYHLGLAYARLGRNDDAFKAFYEAARLNPVSTHGMMSLKELKKLKAVLKKSH